MGTAPFFSPEHRKNLGAKVAEHWATRIFDERSKGRHQRGVEAHVSESELRGIIQAAIESYEILINDGAALVTAKPDAEPVTILLDRTCPNCGEGMRYTVQPGQREGLLECGHKGDPACPAACTAKLLDRARRLYAAHQIVAEYAAEVRDGRGDKTQREWMKAASKDSRTMHDALDANVIFDEVCQRLGLTSGVTDKDIEVLNAVTARGHLERFAGEWLEEHPAPAPAKCECCKMTSAVTGDEPEPVYCKCGSELGVFCEACASKSAPHVCGGCASRV